MLNKRSLLITLTLLISCVVSFVSTVYIPINYCSGFIPPYSITIDSNLFMTGSPTSDGKVLFINKLRKGCLKQDYKNANTATQLTN